MPLILRFRVIAVVASLKSLVLACAIILPSRIGVGAVRCSCREGCSAGVAGSFPITACHIGGSCRGVRAIPNCIKRNRCVVRVASTSAIGGTCGTARRTPTHERVSTASGDNGRQRECNTISLGLTGRRTRTSVSIVAYCVGLNGFLGIATVVAYRYRLSTGGGACEVMSFIAYRSDSRGAGRAVAVILMLCATVLFILCGLGMGSVLISGVVTIGAILRSSVLTGGIIRPITVVVGAVCCACGCDHSAVITYAFPITACHVILIGRGMVARPDCI